jgi:hypothetical protein
MYGFSETLSRKDKMKVQTQVFSRLVRRVQDPEEWNLGWTMIKNKTMLDGYILPSFPSAGIAYAWKIYTHAVELH